MIEIILILGAIVFTVVIVGVATGGARIGKKLGGTERKDDE